MANAIKAGRLHNAPCATDSHRTACLSLWERWHAAGVTERVHVRPLRPKSQISASSPKGGAKNPLSRRIRGASSPINGGAFGAVQ